VKNDRPFLHRINWATPYSGLLQTLFQRAVSSGSYYPLEELSIKAIAASTGAEVKKSHLVVAGMMAGIANALVINPIAAVKV
jgi:hypothetical protein